jgi:hypothetical protein
MNDFGHTLIFFYKDIYFSVSSKATLVGDASFLKQSAFRMQHPRRGNRVSISLSCLESQSRESWVRLRLSFMGEDVATR